MSSLSQHHHYHNITTITISPLSQYHHYHNITTISPLSHYHHYRNITAITTSPKYRHCHNITTITTSLSQSRTKASFSHLPLSDFEGSLARNAFLRESGFTKCCVLQDKTCPGRWMGKLVRRAVAEHLRLGADRESLARKLRFDIFNCRNLREVSHCNGCIKVAWRGGCVRNTIVFCSWTSYIGLEWVSRLR